jgi:hypothetical protein
VALRLRFLPHNDHTLRATRRGPGIRVRRAMNEGRQKSYSSRNRWPQIVVITPTSNITGRIVAPHRNRSRRLIQSSSYIAFLSLLPRIPSEPE